MLSALSPSLSLGGGAGADPRTRLAAHPFDFGDYLLFHTRWEDAISGL